MDKIMDKIMKGSSFRNSVARFLRDKRNYRYISSKEGYSKAVIKLQVVAFCDGWSAFGDEVDRISEKYQHTDTRKL